MTEKTALGLESNESQSLNIPQTVNGNTRGLVVDKNPHSPFSFLSLFTKAIEQIPFSRILWLMSLKAV